jgi:hypothetical protein
VVNLPNLFAVPFGLDGLAEAWHAAKQTPHTALMILVQLRMLPCSPG